MRGCEVRSVVGIDLHAARRRALELDAASRKLDVGGLADGEDDRVGGNHGFGAGFEGRVEAAVGVEHRRHRDRLESGDLASVADEAVRSACGTGS